MLTYKITVSDLLYPSKPQTIFIIFIVCLTETCLGDGAALQGLKIELVVWGKGQGQTALISIVPETLLMCVFSIPFTVAWQSGCI